MTKEGEMTEQKTATNWIGIDSLSQFLVPIQELKLDPNNARKHSQYNIDIIANSLRKYGQQTPIVHKNGVVVKGNATVTAAKSLGWTHISAVETDLAGKPLVEYKVVDNRASDLSEFDDAVLKENFIEINDGADNFQDVIDVGFSEKEVKAILGIEDKTDPRLDHVPDKPDFPTAKLGDLWALGNHRLLCGDATKKEDVEMLLAGCVPILMITDPPYGVNYDPKWREEFDEFEKHSTGKVKNDDVFEWYDAYKFFPGDVVYVWHAGVFAAETSMSLRKNDFKIRNQIIWRKQHFVFGRGAYHWQHEPCWYAVRKGKKSNWIGDRTQSSVWDIKNSNPLGGKREDKTIHSTEKPFECMARPLRNHSGDVYDPFVGSGTTLIAAEELKRKCYAIDIDPGYCDVTIKRWEKLTGQKAKRIEENRELEKSS